ncbi:hypothetical protein [Nocardia amikacinitolerans]|uniref:hypothetical protein n=1 Tax=Nocardia amikacinitolerans TaxID=756689 RepID=UPI0020A25B5B|nr:hypothetical protein [Nocardia amikacinitolerans]MCP2274660.1 hypothetical protein [Nocardia amikacinitolerans]
MFVLPDLFLTTQDGTIRCWPLDRDDPSAGTWSITIPLEPFSAVDEYDPRTFRLGSSGPEVVETSVRLDYVELPTNTLADLSGRTFTFPVNPADGFIDASIYLGGGHCPVDITRIQFGRATPRRIPATLHAYFDFAQEAVEIENRAAVLTADLALED